MFTVIVVVLSLVFLIPSSGLSLLGLAAYLFIKFYSQHSRVESTIAQVANEGWGSYCVNIPYSEVVAYAQGSESIINVQGEMVTFLANIKGSEYEVVVNREPLGRKAIIESTLIN